MGLERRPQRAYRCSLECGRSRPPPQIRGRIGCALADVILADTRTVVAALQEATQIVPIVFAGVIDPVGAGFVASLARPGGNTTGFASLDYGTLLKEIAPQLKRVAVLREPDIASGIGQLAVIQSAAPSFGVEVRPVVSPSPRPTRSPAPLSA